MRVGSKRRRQQQQGSSSNNNKSSSSNNETTNSSNGDSKKSSCSNDEKADGAEQSSPPPSPRRTKRQRTQTKLYNAAEEAATSVTASTSVAASVSIELSAKTAQQLKSFQVTHELKDADEAVRRLLAVYEERKTERIDDINNSLEEGEIVKPDAVVKKTNKNSRRSRRKGDKNELGKAREPSSNALLQQEPSIPPPSKEESKDPQASTEQRNKEEDVKVGEESKVEEELNAKESKQTKRRKRRKKDEITASIAVNDEADPSEKILKRKRIGSYDCRKTPAGGIVNSGTATAAASDSENKTSAVDAAAAADAAVADQDDEEEGEALREVGGSGQRQSGAAAAGVRAFSLSPNWCRNCDRRHDSGQSACPLRRPTQSFTDAVIDFSKGGSDDGGEENLVSPDGLDLSKSFAQLSLPSPLRLTNSNDKDSNTSNQLCVVARTAIPAHAQFGPLVGERILERDVSAEETDMKDLWPVFTQDGKRNYVTTVNPEKSNWIRYLRPANQRRDRNVACVVRDVDKLFFVTLKRIERNEELRYWIDDPDLMWTKKRAEKKNCGGCNLRFAHPLHYRLHCSIFHDPQFSLTIRKYHCKVCGLAVLGKDNIVKHALAEHDGRGAYQCQFCKKYFLRLNYLDMHRTYGCSSNPGRTRPLCHLCGKKFCQPQKLKIHMKRMHGDSSLLSDLRCQTCSKILGSRNALQRHMREVHNNSNNNIQEGSNSSRASSSSNSSSGVIIQQQQQQEKSVVDSAASTARVACEKCGRTFKNKSNLKIHMLTHSGVKPFWCKSVGCRSGFTTKQCLQFHYRKAHGLTDEAMPRIEREIPYTLSAYSGGMIGGSKGGHDGESGGKRIFRPSQLSESTSSNPQANKSGEDVYSFEDDDDDEVRDKEETRKEPPPPSANDAADRRSPSPEVPPSQKEDDSGGNKAGLLVMAALNAAEQDMKVSNNTTDEEKQEKKEAEVIKTTSSSFLSHSAQSLISTSSNMEQPCNSSSSSNVNTNNSFLPPISTIASKSYNFLPPPVEPPTPSYYYPGLDLPPPRSPTYRDYPYHHHPPHPTYDLDELSRPSAPPPPPPPHFDPHPLPPPPPPQHFLPPLHDNSGYIPHHQVTPAPSSNAPCYPPPAGAPPNRLPPPPPPNPYHPYGGYF